MADVVIKLPVRGWEEAQRFGDYLNRFLEDLSHRAERWAADTDAPFLMVRSDPQPDLDIKILIFQEMAAARDFQAGWARSAAGHGHA